MISFSAMAAADAYFAGKIGTAEQGAVGFCSTLVWTVLCFSFLPFIPVEGFFHLLVSGLIFIYGFWP